jgi:hypothetical protein
MQSGQDTNAQALAKVQSSFDKMKLLLMATLAACAPLNAQNAPVPTEVSAAAAPAAATIPPDTQNVPMPREASAATASIARPVSSFQNQPATAR